MELSARNALKGIVKHIHSGEINSEVILELVPGIEVTAIITKSSVESLGLEEGKQAYAVIKSSDVMISID